ncbi:MAG TPA: hypothetical protein VM389_14720, partial [Phycisphaerae bacterium]|nr:hypothetical protein [Phycisphaerae bacterium]
TVDGEAEAGPEQSELQVLVHGMFEHRRLLDLVRYFNVFEADDGGVGVKKMAAYHQYFAVNRAVDCTVRAASPGGDGRIGVIWHTQGTERRQATFPPDNACKSPSRSTLWVEEGEGLVVFRFLCEGTGVSRSAHRVSPVLPPATRPGG